AERDPLILAAQHRAPPDARILLQAHAADHHRGFGDPVAAVSRKIRGLSVERVDRHTCAPASAFSKSGNRFLRPERASHEERANWHVCRQAKSSENALNAVTTTVPDIRLQKPASTVASMTNSKRRRSMRRPRMMLRMMTNGAAKVS